MVRRLWDLRWGWVGVVGRPNEPAPPITPTTHRTTQLPRRPRRPLLAPRRQRLAPPTKPRHRAARTKPVRSVEDGVIAPGDPVLGRRTGGTTIGRRADQEPGRQAKRTGTGSLSLGRRRTGGPAGTSFFGSADWGPLSATEPRAPSGLAPSTPKYRCLNRWPTWSSISRGWCWSLGRGRVQPHSLKPAASTTAVAAALSLRWGSRPVRVAPMISVTMAEKERRRFAWLSSASS